MTDTFKEDREFWRMMELDEAVSDFARRWHDLSSDPEAVTLTTATLNEVERQVLAEWAEWAARVGSSGAVFVDFSAGQPLLKSHDKLADVRCYLDRKMERAHEPRDLLTEITRDLLRFAVVEPLLRDMPLSRKKREPEPEQPNEEPINRQQRRAADREAKKRRQRHG